MTIFLWSFSLVMLGVLCAYSIIDYRFGYRCHVALKMCASTIFLLASILGLVLFVNAQARDAAFGVLILCGGICGLAGDLLLALCEKKGERLFICGVAAFLINHLFFIFALFSVTPFHWLDLLLVALMVCIVLGCIRPLKLNIPKSLKLPCFFYMLVISYMLMRSLSFLWSARSFEPADFVFLAGAVLFVLSDVVLAINKFAPKTRGWMFVLNTFTYFPGQLLIAFSMIV